MASKRSQRLDRALEVVNDPHRTFIAQMAMSAGDMGTCFYEMRKVMAALVVVLESIPIASFSRETGDPQIRAFGRNLALTTDERALLDKLLINDLKKYIANAEEVQTVQADELDRNNGYPNETVLQLDRFRTLVIEKRATALVKSFATAIHKLAKYAKADPNPYLLSFDIREKKKYVKAENKMKEDYVFYYLLLGDLMRHQALLMRQELPFEGQSLDRSVSVLEKQLEEERNRVVQEARDNYQAAFDYAKENLPNTHPFVLRIGFSFATMYYDFLDNPDAAVELAHTIHREVAPRVLNANKSAEAAVRNEALPILQELEEKLFLWTVVQPMDSQDPKCYDSMTLDQLLEPLLKGEY
eukprot:TRINITY_DN383_c0_g1_i2.p1 TRINITY_DN383_c0_g1~~TRINITY_DN383_c0_g1_i2.p1  ORF type:complete len:356 (-),score=102.09 TRINITY_DN383_c0_g1_i2:200-1267(-)